MQYRKVTTFGKRLRELLMHLEINQRDVAKRTALTECLISLYASDKRMPGTYNLCLIAETYEVNPAWLLGYDVPMR